MNKKNAVNNSVSSADKKVAGQDSRRPDNWIDLLRVKQAAETLEQIESMLTNIISEMQWVGTIDEVPNKDEVAETLLHFQQILEAVSGTRSEAISIVNTMEKHILTNGIES